MDRRNVLAAASLGVALFLLPCIGAAEENFIAEAIADILKSISYGEEGDANLAMSHAKVALHYVEAAGKSGAILMHPESQRAKANPNAKMAIKHLKATIDNCKRGDAPTATRYAEAALSQLQHVR
jgi:hypothetical protein